MIFGTTVSVFRNKSFAALWCGSVASNIGGQIQMVGAAWLMTAMTNSHGMVSMVQSAASLPIVLGSLVTGALADSFDRRRLMLGAQCFMLAISALLVIISLQGGLSPWLLLGITFLIGCGTALHNPSWHSTIGELVGERDLAAAISLNAMGNNVTRAVGPAAGGIIVATLGAAAAFAANALTYLALIIALLAWKPRTVQHDLPREAFLGAMITGLRFFILSPKLLNPAFRAAVFGFAAIPVQSLLPLISRDQLGGDAMVFGMLLAFYGAGAVVAALSNAWLRARLSSEILCRTGFVCCACCSIVIGLSTSAPLTILAIFLSGLWWLGIFSLLNVTVQMATPKWVLGRVLSIYMCCMFGGMTLGGWFWGMVAEVTTPGQALIASASAMVFGAAWGLWRPLQELARDDLAPAPLPQTAVLQLPIPPDAGPVTITIEYEIHEPALADFLHCMVERRRLRLREGGRSWQLQRDLERAERWVESFSFPNWLDYLRHHRRRVQADIDLVTRLRALHAGKEPPRVWRTTRAIGAIGRSARWPMPAED